MPNTAGPALEIYVHLQDARIVRFAQTEAGLAQEILDHIQPGKFFTQHHFVIGGDQSMTAFRCASVVRIDFVTDYVPEWPFHYGAKSIQEISEGEYRERYRPDLHTGRVVPATDTEGLSVVYSELELVNGERVFFEVHVDRSTPDGTPMLRLDQSLFVQQLFTSGGLYGRRRGSGILLLNPGSIVRMAFYPGPSETPAGAWPAHRLRD